MPSVQSDRIHKQIIINAPRSRVWRALTDAQQFGQWFGVKVNGTFAPGRRLQGQVTHKGYEHLTWDVTIEQMEPERLFSWRWHPGAVEAGRDYSAEPTTLVVFELKDVDGGTLLTVDETGFDRLPPERLSDAYRQNDEGWAAQMQFIQQYVGRPA